MTPLMYAAREGKETTVKVIQPPTVFGDLVSIWLTLLCAVQILCQASGLDVDVRNETGMSALLLACAVRVDVI